LSKRKNINKKLLKYGLFIKILPLGTKLVKRGVRLFI